MQLKNGDPPALLAVDKMAVTSYKHHNGKVLIEFRDLRVPDQPSKVYWGGPTLNHLAGDIKSGAVIIVHETKAKDYKLEAEIVQAADYDWTCGVVRLYEKLPKLATVPTGAPPHSITIKHAGSHRKSKQPILMDTAGKVWRFAAPQNYKPNVAKNQPGLALISGHILTCNEHTITVAPPPHA